MIMTSLAMIAAPVATEGSDSLAIQAVHNFGACIVRESPTGAVEKVLDMDFRTEAYQKRLRAIAKGHDRCILNRWQLSSNRVLIAGAMAEALLKSEVKIEEMPRRLAYDPARQVIQARSPTETMALCTVLNAPQPTTRLLATEPATKEEAKAIEAVSPVLGQCLKKDLKVALNPPAVRSLLALAAWRIASTPKAATQ
jgi:hypothetical protein